MIIRLFEAMSSDFGREQNRLTLQHRIGFCSRLASIRVNIVIRRIEIEMASSGRILT